MVHHCRNGPDCDIHSSDTLLPQHRLNLPSRPIFLLWTLNALGVCVCVCVCVCVLAHACMCVCVFAGSDE